MGYFRYPRTLQERTYQAALETDEDVVFWGIRISRRWLPDSYDDLTNMSIYDRCWKRFRRVRYVRTS